MTKGIVQTQAQEVVMKVLESCLHAVSELPNLEGSMHMEMFMSFLDEASEVGDSDHMVGNILIHRPTPFGRPEDIPISVVCTLDEGWRTGAIEVSKEGNSQKWGFAWQIDDTGEVMVISFETDNSVHTESAV